jgi:hypothetical protein
VRLVVLVTGCRDWTDYGSIRDALSETVEQIRPTEVALIHGDCPTGADKIANDWAPSLGFSAHPMPADWAKHGKAAGPIRNREMVQATIAIRNMNHGKAVCLAFWDGESRGTLNCIQEAIRVGLPVRIIPRAK